MKAWVVDTCVVLDIALNDAAHGVKSAQLLQSKLRDGLVASGNRPQVSRWSPRGGRKSRLLPVGPTVDFCTGKIPAPREEFDVKTPPGFIPIIYRAEQS